MVKHDLSIPRALLARRRREDEGAPTGSKQSKNI
jgi:hypothetical protein